ncbi:MAG: EAL domain-containing protein [Lachnospiraceae bacterium]|nr:EAL domain-containing protein [Lachnospiraceae bacterium]
MDAFDLKKSGELPDVEINLATLKFAFQPIFDIKTGDVFGYEALMRPGQYTPTEVIQSYANVDMLDYIEGITFYFATKAFFDAKLEGNLFLNTFPGTCMSADMAVRTISTYGSQLMDRLFIEVLEYTKLNPTAWATKKKVLEDTGLRPRYAIDDFGTGENFNLRCIRQYKPNLVKIDRQFISHIDTDLRNQEIVDEMIHYMHASGIQVLAEGVETEAEYLYLMKKDIDYMQGFYLGKPTIYR